MIWNDHWNMSASFLILIVHGLQKWTYLILSYLIIISYLPDLTFKTAFKGLRHLKALASLPCPQPLQPGQLLVGNTSESCCTGTMVALGLCFWLSLYFIDIPSWQFAHLKTMFYHNVWEPMGLHQWFFCSAWKRNDEWTWALVLSILLENCADARQTLRTGPPGNEEQHENAKTRWKAHYVFIFYLPCQLHPVTVCYRHETSLPCHAMSFLRPITKSARFIYPFSIPSAIVLHACVPKTVSPGRHSVCTETRSWQPLRIPLRSKWGNKAGKWKQFPGSNMPGLSQNFTSMVCWIVQIWSTSRLVGLGRS